MPALTLYSEYSRQHVHDIFSPDTRFTQSSGSWGLHGIVDIPGHPGDFVFFVTFGQHQAGHTFDEWITEEGVISWQSQPRQSFEDRRIQQFIHHDDSKNSIHLFLRTRRAATYTYLGKLRYLAHDPAREKPVYMYWQLADWPIPQDALGRLNLALQPAGIVRGAIRESPGQYTFFTGGDGIGVDKTPNQRQHKSPPPVVKRHHEDAFVPQVQILSTKIYDIHQVLAGSAEPASDEVLCDWVHFCYDFGLYREGQMLFAFVTSEQVNPWYYERTRKLARLCSMRAAAKDDYAPKKSG